MQLSGTPIYVCAPTPVTYCLLVLVLQTVYYQRTKTLLVLHIT
jgi:hypothetical protein